MSFQYLHVGGREEKREERRMGRVRVRKEKKKDELKQRHMPTTVERDIMLLW